MAVFNRMYRNICKQKRTKIALVSSVCMFCILLLLLQDWNSITSVSNRRMVMHKNNVSENRWYDHCDDDFKKNHIITTVSYRPKARTGNLLFILFCMLALSRKHCYTPVLEGKFDYLDDIFDIENVGRFNVSERNLMYLHESPKTLRSFDTSLNAKLEMLKHSNWTLGGARQSYKYFYFHEDFVKSSVRFKQSILDNVIQYMHDQNSTDTPLCSIHVRRTETKSDEFLNWYYSYILKAIEFVRKKIPHVKFVFVSDDIQWCKENFGSSNITFSPFDSPGEDLALLSLCNHSILTRGTFGWMGAWLGNKGNGALIVYNAFVTNKDFLPPNWIVGEQFDISNRHENQSRYFKTIYAFVDSVSTGYRNTFMDSLTEKLKGLQDSMEDA